MVDKKEELKEDRYSLVEITTQTDMVIKDKKEDKTFTNQGLLLEILNKLDRIERSLA